MLMAFFGCEVKPNKPFSFGANPVKGRLHLSLATLGMGSSATPNKSILQCISGDASPVFLCSLFPEKYETCQLHLEFEEADDVVFSVIGPRSIHITGYYLGTGSSAHHLQLKDESESYGEDIAATESERSCDDEDYGGSFINDGEPGVYSTSSESMDGGRVEKISSHSNSVKVRRRRLRKKYQLSKDESSEKDRLKQHEDHDLRNKEHVSDGNCAVGSFKSPSLLKKGPKKALRRHKGKGQESDSGDSTGGFFISSSSLLDKSHSNNNNNKSPTTAKKIDEDNLNTDIRKGDTSDFALQGEPKREALDDGTGTGTEEAKKKKKKKERKKRKLKLREEGTESVVGIENDNDGQEEDPGKIESNSKNKKQKKKKKG